MKNFEKNKIKRNKRSFIFFFVSQKRITFCLKTNEMHLSFCGVPAIDSAACELAACLIRLGYPIIESRAGDARDSCMVHVPETCVWMRVGASEMADIVVSLCPESGKNLFTTEFEGEEFSETHLKQFMREFTQSACSKPTNFKSSKAVSVTQKVALPIATKVVAAATSATLAQCETGAYSRPFSEDLFHKQHIAVRPKESGALAPSKQKIGSAHTQRYLEEMLEARTAADRAESAARLAAKH